MYLSMLGKTVDRARWRCLAYCLMDNHVHLLVETPEANLGFGMQRLHGSYALSLNQRHKRSGHVFQGRYGSTWVKDEPQLWTVVRYVALNPVEAGLGEAVDWRWSSHAAILGGGGPGWVDVDRLLSFFWAGGGGPLARAPGASPCSP